MAPVVLVGFPLCAPVTTLSLVHAPMSQEGPAPQPVAYLSTVPQNVPPWEGGSEPVGNAESQAPPQTPRIRPRISTRSPGDS